MELGVSYIPVHLPEHIEADMRDLAEMGCTEVLFALQENHIHILTGALRFGADIAKVHGLRPYAVIWGFANTFGGGRISKAMLDDPELWCRMEDGTPYPKACLNNPHLTERFVEIASLCRDHGYEGLFIDEPTKQECFCRHCREAFAAGGGRDLLAGKGTPEYASFRAAAVRDYTAAVCRRVKELDPQLRTITCVMPHDRDTWADVVAIPELDVFGTDPYWLLSGGRMTLEQAVADAVKVKRISAQNEKLSQVWLNCWGIPSGREEEIHVGGRALAEAGCDSLYAWSYRGGLGTNEVCDDPERAWASVVRLYRELAGRD
jgi:hypothetical protein